MAVEYCVPRGRKGKKGFALPRRKAAPIISTTKKEGAVGQRQVDLGDEGKKKNEGAQAATVSPGRGGGKKKGGGEWLQTGGSVQKEEKKKREGVFKPERSGKKGRRESIGDLITRCGGVD